MSCRELFHDSSNIGLLLTRKDVAALLKNALKFGVIVVPFDSPGHSRDTDTG